MVALTGGYMETSPYRTLVAAVLLRAVRDACAPGGRHAHEARRWLAGAGRQWADWLDVDLDPLVAGGFKMAVRPSGWSTSIARKV